MVTAVERTLSSIAKAKGGKASAIDPVSPASPDDAKWGFTFGVDGVLDCLKACDFLGVSRTSLYRLADQGRIRRRVMKLRGEVSGKACFCRKSLQLFLANLPAE